MSLEEILQDIELRGKQELDELTLYYENKLSELEAKQSAALTQQSEKIRKASEEEKRTAERTIVSSAEMEALNNVRGKEGALIDEAAEKAELYLKDIKERKDYPDILAKMVEIAKRTLGEDCSIVASKGDSSIISAGKSKITVREVDPFGGIMAESADGSRELDLTVSAIITEIREKLVSKLFEYIGE